MMAADNGCMGRIEVRRLARYVATGVIVLAIGGAFAWQQWGERGRAGGGESGLVAVGEAAPDFALRTLDGQTVRLADYRGKTVVVNFWASWCPPCRQEMPEFEALYRERQAAGDFVVLALDYRPLDSERDVQRFLDGVAQGSGQALTFPIVLDADGEVAARYGVAPRGARQATLPVSFFVDRNGVLRDRVFGPVTGTLLERVRATEAAAR
jgi:peroxiredoxin